VSSVALVASRLPGTAEEILFMVHFHAFICQIG
jgi:hypothetical protein